jgi:arylsulfatase A-like enzyme
MPMLTRRDFLKLSASVSASLAFSGVRPALHSLRMQNSGKPNIIVLLFDATSARNMSLYGYGRETTPNLSRFAERATVYHSHYAAGSFTTSGTASILTGLYPWKHRALNMRAPIRRDLVGQDIFALLGSDYQRTAFTQNMFTQVFLRQFRHAIDNHLPLTSFGMGGSPSLFSENFPYDPMVASFAFDASLYSNEVPTAILSNYLYLMFHPNMQKYQNASDEYPYGLPYDSYNYFENQTVFDGVAQTILKSADGVAPFFGYYHLYSPHLPYAPRKEFVDIFPEIDIPRKPYHKLVNNRQNNKTLLGYRKEYDEFIANVDAEFGRLYDKLEQSGVLENSYLIVTSDHGEMFERGEHGHLGALLYDPGIHVPLLISAPGQRARQDLYAATSNVDLLPTILNLSGRPIPADLDGKLLPGLGGTQESNRSIFIVEAKENSAFMPLSKATIALIKDGYKIIYYVGYAKVPEDFELYNLRDDPEELTNLLELDPAVAAVMKQELLDSLADANRPYLTPS